MNARSLVLFASLILTSSAIAVARQVISCDAYSPVLSLPAQCQTSYGYSQGTDACRAAISMLRIALVAPTGYVCANDGCAPGSCHSAVYYWDPTQLSYGPPILNMETGLYACTACWMGGTAQIYCTPCAL